MPGPGSSRASQRRWRGISAAITGLLGVTGWLGGELSYRYKIGVAGVRPGEVGSAPADQTSQRQLV